MIPYGRQDITPEDIEAVNSALKSDFLTQGPLTPTFEKDLCAFLKVKYATAVNSATSALHISCMALGLGKGDYVWTSPNTFVASANCGLYCNANVDFVDIDKKTYNMCPILLRKKLENAKKENKLPKIVIPVHFAGQSCDMKEIASLSKEFGFKIIEDASHAIGGKYFDEYIGGCKYSDIAVFSFHPVKIITTAEGGVAVTNSEELAHKMSLFKSHGITRDKELLSKDEGPWYYEQLYLGLNYRMTEIQAALGISQLKRVNNFISRRHNLAQRYHSLLSDLPIILPYQEKFNYSSYHLFPIQINPDKTNRSRKEVFNEMREKGIGVNVHYIPVHMQPYFLSLGFNKRQFLNAENYYANAISIPLFYGLSYQQQEKVCSVLREALL